MKTPRELELARLAVERGLISHSQLQEALDELTARLEQSENPTTDSLSIVTVLIAKGFLKAEDVASLTPPPPREPPDADLPEEVRQASRYPDSRFGKYTVLRLLGTGGMGAVYRAWDNDLRRLIALKFLTVGSDENIRRFIREAQIAARLNHPNIAQVHDAGSHQGRHYIAMEYVDGVTLDALPEDLRKTQIDRMLALLREVALAIDYAHSKGIVHRDLKPQNVMVDEYLKPHIMDFGLARPLTEDDEGDASLPRAAHGRQITIPGMVVGTPNYLAPEQARGEQVRLDPRTDVYGFGATIFGVLTGTPPFDAGSPLDTLMDVLQKDPPRPSLLNPRIPRDLDTVILRCLEKEPLRRYQSAREAADELQRILGGEPILARRPGVTRRVRQALRRRPTTVAVALSLAILLATSVVFTIELLRIQREHRANLQRQREEVEQRRQEQARRAEALTLVEQAEFRLARIRRLGRSAGSAGVERERLLREALQELDRALAIDATSAAGVLARGEILAMKGDMDRAIADLTRALQLRPEIREQVERRIAVDVDDAEAHALDCMLKVAQRRWREAVDAGRRAVRLRPTLAEWLGRWIDRADAQR